MKIIRQSVAIVLGIFLVYCTTVFAFAAETRQLEPQKTYALITGVLSWQDTSLSSFPKKNRKDKELSNVLKNMGIPNNQVTLLLDKQATKSSIIRDLERVAKGAGTNSTLIFYYAGHGIMDGNAGAYFANYDISSKNARSTGLSSNDIFNAINNNFKGRNVILMADCCYSGALVSVAQKLSKSGKNAIALTSAAASNYSTANWTFTQAIIDGLNGSSLVDTNKDSNISLSELANEVSNAMKYREKQMYGKFFPASLNNFVLTKARNTKSENSSSAFFPIGSYVNATLNGKISPARILSNDRETYAAEFYNYSDKIIRKFKQNQINKIAFQTYPVGKKLSVMWGSKAYPAKVLKTADEFMWITYPGWPQYWDEWITSYRIADSEASQGPQILVEWQGTWYPAMIIKKTSDKAYIHYVGYGSDWDEWVTFDRIREKQ